MEKAEPAISLSPICIACHYFFNKASSSQEQVLSFLSFHSLHCEENCIIFCFILFFISPTFSDSSTTRWTWISQCVGEAVTQWEVWRFSSEAKQPPPPLACWNEHTSTQHPVSKPTKFSIFPREYYRFQNISKESNIYLSHDKLLSFSLLASSIASKFGFPRVKGVQYSS